MPRIGEVTQTNFGFEWKIPNFESPSENHHSSPSFTFFGEFCQFIIFSNDISLCNTVDYGVLLVKTNCSSGDEVSFAFKTLAGERDQDRPYIKGVTLPEGEVVYQDIHCLQRSELLRRKSELLPSNVLTVLCILKHPVNAANASVSGATKCSYCRQPYTPEFVSEHEKKCAVRPIKCPECCDDLLLQDWYKHECQASKEKDYRSACQDFKRMLLDGTKHDLVFKIGEKQIRAHQDVLRVRSRVFESMLTHDMIERNSGIIDVPDCDPQAMEQFLLYVYCGKVETLDESNMLNLYYIADKYEMEGLKTQCSEFIKKSLSHTNVCDIILLAMKHSDSSLLEYATEHFMANTLNIMVTEEWQSFLMDNYTVGNDLLIKSFQNAASKK